MDILLEKWNEILEHVREEHELSDISYKTWLLPLSVADYRDDTVYLLVSDRSMLDYLKKKYYRPLKVAIGEVTGLEADIVFVLTGENSSEEVKKIGFTGSIAGLNPKYTFDTFIVGKNNQFAHAAALAVAESPGEIYNPLFLYGGVGLGKTHLMNAIAHFIYNNNPEANIIYVTSEEFTNEVIDAIRNGNSSALTKLRDKYRNIDVLLLDDVQFIIGKESTQEEFFHTFNALYNAGKQIILSSDRPPKEMDILEERIRSRFEWGLMADIKSPDYETRIAILQKKQEMDGYKIDSSVIEYIAKNIDSNIRELEGTLNKVIALANLEKQPVTIELAEKALRDIISPEEKKVITPSYIIDIVAETFDLTTEDLVSEKKSRKLSYPRQLAMYLCREMTNSNLEQIGSIMNKDHSTVHYGVTQIEKQAKTNEKTQGMIQLLKKKINPPS